MRHATYLAAAVVLLGTMRCATAADFVFPETGKISVPYGAKLQGGAIHRGVDISGSSGTPVVAARGGRITFFGPRSGYGTLLVVEHEQGFETYYAYVAAATKPVGSTVKQGETIGKQGKDHIHFELRRFGSRFLIPGAKGDALVRGRAIPVSFAALRPAPKPAPAPAAPAPLAGPWDKAGAWCVNADGFSTQLHGDLMVKNRVSWVAVLVHDGLTENARNASYFQSGWIAQLRAKGVKVGAWGVQRTDPEGEAKLAAQLVQKWGFDFYIADAEAEYKYTSPSGAFDPTAYGRSKRFVAEFRKLLPKLPAALSTYGRADLCDIDWAAWRGAGFVYLPQTYWNEFDIYQPSLCMTGAVKAGWAKDQVFPTIGIWGGGQRQYVPAADYVADMKKAGVVGFSFYVAESMALTEWNVFGPAIAGGLAR